MSRNDYIWSEESDWHMTRQKNILKDYPEVKRLFGIDPNTKYYGPLLLFTQLWLSITAPSLSWPMYMLSVYFLGATFMQTLFLLIHECSHNLLFNSTFNNRIFSYLVQLAVPVAFSESFRYYHKLHHTDLTVENKDTDIPTKTEAEFTRNGKLSKLVWMQCNLLAYIIRPSLLLRMPVTKYLIYNWTIQLLFNILFYSLFGIRPFIYSIVSIFMSGGLHPLAGHFICEHYIMPGIPTDQETISYYGPFNIFIWNAGHHVEHHDFKSIPWTRLPMLKHMAPSYYDNLATYDSYIYAIYTFITDNTVSGYSRVRRKEKNN